VLGYASRKISISTRTGALDARRVVFHRTRERAAFICEWNYSSRLGRNGFSATFTETGNDVGRDGGW